MPTTLWVAQGRRMLHFNASLSLSLSLRRLCPHGGGAETLVPLPNRNLWTITRRGQGKHTEVDVVQGNLLVNKISWLSIGGPGHGGGCSPMKFLESRNDRIYSLVH